MQILRENNENKVKTSKDQNLKIIELADTQDLYRKNTNKNEFMNKFDELKNFLTK